MAAAAAPFLGGLEHQAAGGLGPIEQLAVDARGQGLQQLGLAGGGLQGNGRLRRQGGARFLLQPGLALRSRQGQQGIEIHRRGELLLGSLGLALQADAAAGDAAHRIAHDPLVHRADLLHIERPVADALAVHDQQVAQHRQHRAVADPGRLQPGVDRRDRTAGHGGPAGSRPWGRRHRTPAGTGSSARPRRRSAAPSCRGTRLSSCWSCSKIALTL